VTFVELFFDLVFVFAVTQIVSLLHHDLDLIHVLQAMLIFWLIWWSWQQFAWSLNYVDTTHSGVQLVTLLATVFAFFMAIGIPSAFSNSGLLFAIAYIITRLIGLVFQNRLSGELGNRAVANRWIYSSLVGLFAVLLGGILGGDLQYLFWILAIVSDLYASTQGVGDWSLNLEHMAERHGLIVIIALGESLIIAAAGLVDQDLNANHLLVGAFSVIITCGLWWSYFASVKPEIEKAIEPLSGVEMTVSIRDVYVLAHFPMIAGVIAFALAIEGEILRVISNPKDEILPEIVLSLAIGIGLFMGGYSTFVLESNRCHNEEAFDNIDHRVIPHNLRTPSDLSNVTCSCHSFTL